MPDTLAAPPAEAKPGHNSAAVGELNEAARPPAGASAADIGGLLKLVRGVSIDEAVFRERTEEVTGVRDRVAATLAAAHANAVRAEEAQAELARIKEEQAAKERAEAEAKAKADAKAEADRLAEAERKRQADEVKAAEERAAAAAKAKADAEANAARERERKAAQAKLDAAEAERKAAAEALAKKEREEAKARAKAEAEAAERKRREADQAHRERVVADAIDALVRHTSLTDEQARAAIMAIAAGQVPALTITF